MNLRRTCTLIGLAVLATATAAEARVHRVHPGESIQAAIDAASSGDTILVWPGVYQEDPTSRYGLHVTQDDIRLIGKANRGQGEAGKVVILQNGAQETGIYAAPPGCEYDEHESLCGERLEGFYVRGFTVEGFPKNGIQTRWVDGFKFIRNESRNNLNNGIYPTLSTDGLVRSNVSYGSADTAMWVAGCERVRVIGNEAFHSPIGFEITVSNDVWARHNDIHDNTIGVGLFHPNAAGNDPRPGGNGNWVLEHNDIYSNNVFNDDLPNPAPPDSFQAGVPPGVGVLLLGVSDLVVRKNDIEDNFFVGIGVLGWCTATSLGDPDRNCINDPPIADPSANDNLISKNRLNGNATGPSPVPPLPAVDILYVQTPPPAGPEPGTGNCFEKNKPSTFTFFSSEPDGELPTDGC